MNTPRGGGSGGEFPGTTGMHLTSSNGTKHIHICSQRASGGTKRMQPMRKGLLLSGLARRKVIVCFPRHSARDSVPGIRTLMLLNKCADACGEVLPHTVELFGLPGAFVARQHRVCERHALVEDSHPVVALLLLSYLAAGGTTIATAAASPDPQRKG